jgi:hypothetical protein
VDDKGPFCFVVSFLIIILYSHADADLWSRKKTSLIFKKPSLTLIITIAYAYKGSKIFVHTNLFIKFRHLVSYDFVY